MTVPTIWSEETSIKTSETDFKQRWRLSSFFLAMQEIASTHAERLGVGYHTLLDRDLVWVLARVKICIFEYPLVGSPITLETWPKGMQQKLFFMRDFHIRGAGGKILAAASSAYVLVSPTTRRVQMPGPIGEIVPDNNGRAAIPEPLEKIVPVEPLESCQTVQAGYSSVDLLEHVNNARYIDWISDCFSFEAYQAGRPAWLQINFVNETRPGETVQLARGRCPGTLGDWYIAGTNLTTGVKAFEAQMGWEPN